jgi:hypothetical protein
MLDAGRGMIYSALKALQAKWNATEPHWQDTMRVQFAEEVWTPLQGQTEQALDALDQLEVFLRQMGRECEGTTYDIHARD